MSVAEWPADLPKPQRSGYQAQFQDPRKGRSAEAGPPGWDRRYSGVARMVSLSIDVTRSQKAVFDNFFEDVALHGSLPFWMPDPVTDGWALLTSDGVPLLDQDGAPILLSARWLCLFGQDMPTETIYATRFVIGFSVAVMP